MSRKLAAAAICIAILAFALQYTPHKDYVDYKAYPDPLEGLWESDSASSAITPVTVSYPADRLECVFGCASLMAFCCCIFVFFNFRDLRRRLAQSPLTAGSPSRELFDIPPQLAPLEGDAFDLNYTYLGEVLRCVLWLSIIVIPLQATFFLKTSAC